MLLPPGPLPEMVVAAFLAAEDAHFRQHHGIDLRAMVRAAWSNLKAGRIVSGASTVTQQLARLAYPAPRTYYHKLVEMLRSLRLEAALSKDEILRGLSESGAPGQQPHGRGDCRPGSTSVNRLPR